MRTYVPTVLVIFAAFQLTFGVWLTFAPRNRLGATDRTYCTPHAAYAVRTGYSRWRDMGVGWAS